MIMWLKGSVGRSGQRSMDIQRWKKDSVARAHKRSADEKQRKHMAPSWVVRGAG